MSKFKIHKYDTGHWIWFRLRKFLWMEWWSPSMEAGPIGVDMGKLIEIKYTEY